MYRPLRILAAISTVLLLSHCNLLFWRPVEQSVGAVWIQEERVYETLLRYESKLSWNPLDAGSVARNYRTDLILHRIGDGVVASSDNLLSMPGWVLNDSLYSYYAGLLVIQGKGAFGSYANRSVLGIEIAPNLKSAVAVPMLDTEKTVLAAVPSPERSTVAVFLAETGDDGEPGSELELGFYRFGRPSLKRSYKLSSHFFTFEEAPGLPEYTWGNDSTRIFLKLPDGIFSASIFGRFEEADSFPSCFFPTTTVPFTSSEGKRFNRSENIFAVIQEEYDSFRPGDQVPMTENPEDIGENCY